MSTHNHLGNTKKNTGAGAAAATLSKDALRDIREKTEKGQKSEAVVIKADEIERMKAMTKIESKEQGI